MITGLKLDFTTEQLREHLVERATYHREKTKVYADQAAQLDSTTADDETLRGLSNNPAPSLRQSARSHLNKATFFRLMAEHLIPNETYRLEQGDLALLEFYERVF